MEEDIVFLKRLSMALLLSKDIEELCTHMGFSNRVTSVKLHELAEKLEEEWCLLIILSGVLFIIWLVVEVLTRIEKN